MQLTDYINKNTGCIVKFEIQVSTEKNFKCVPCNILDILILKLTCVYLKFKFKWESYILSGNPIAYIVLQNKAEKVFYYSLSEGHFIP